ncbi:unnamed protein product [Camellia sinensis]
MAPLVLFAECLGASRLMDACSWFMDLWKGKHETGQWLEIEAAEAMSNRSDFSAMNASGIMLSSMANKKNESHGDLASEDNGKAAIDASAGDKTVTDANEERAIVLYKPDSHPPEANGSIAQEGNSKVQLLKVLETRKSVLQKEQGMAFARAVAAGFDIDHMAPLVSFAECFGALRLMDACSRFVDLWKGKHETGQWLEIEAAEAMSNRSDFSAMNASGIMLSSMANKQNESHGDLASEDNGKAAIDASAGDKTVTDANEERAIVLYKPDSHPPEANGSIAQEGNSKVQLLKVLETRKSVLQKEQGMAFARAVAAGFDIDHMAPLVSFAECFGALRLMDACSRFVDLWKGKHETGQWLEIEAAEAMSNRSDFSAMNASGIMLSSMANKQNESHGDLASEDNGKAAIDASAGDKTVTDANEERAIVLYKPDSHPPEANGSIAQEGNSKVQLLKVLETRRSVLQKEQGMAFARAVAAGFDIDHMAPLVSFAVVGRDSTEAQDGRITEFHKASGNVARMLRASNDDGLISRGEGHYGDGIGSTDDQMDIQFTETNGRKVLYRNNANDDFMIVGRENQSHFLSSSDPLVVNGFTRATNNLDGSSPQDMIDESFIVPFRSMSLDHVGTNDRTAIDMDSELPSTMQRSEYSSNRTGNQINYEPDDLSFMPECGTEKMTTGYDPALDKEVVVDVKQGSKKSDKDRKSKVAPDALDKKTVGPIRKGKTSKMRPLEDARARAEKLRAFKADIQKMKKNKEEEYRKRLETLKMEREKRIAARTAQLASSQKTRKQLPTKLALSSVKGTNDDQHKPVIDKTVFIVHSNPLFLCQNCFILH